jgi:hypothetical protein
MRLVQLFRRDNSRVVGVAGASKALRLLAGRPSLAAWACSRSRPIRGKVRRLCPRGRPLELSDYAEDGGEEAEVANLYVLAEEGTPLRLGFAIGNERRLLSPRSSIQSYRYLKLLT